MGKNGDRFGDDDVFQLGGDADTEETANIPAWDPADFADDQSPTNPGKKLQQGIPGTTRLKFKKKTTQGRGRQRKEAKTVLPRSIVEDNRRAIDPEGEETLAAWDNLGGRRLAKLDGSQPVRGEAPLKEPHKDTLIRKLVEARQRGTASSELSGLVAEIRRYDPDFDPNEASSSNEILGGETSSGSARLEADLTSTVKLPPLKMNYSPDSLWKRHIAQAIAGLSLIGAVGGMVGVRIYQILDQLEPRPDKTEDVAKPAEPVAVDTPTLAEESAPAATLYDEVGDKLETKTEGTGLSQGAKARIHAASTNDLTESLYDGAKQWETLDGQWLDTPEAHANVVKKLTTWGGYKDVLTVSANANSIDEMLEDIADSDLPNAEYVAWKVAVQIASIKDSGVVPSVEEVETRLNAVDSGTIDQVLDENIQNPPPVPGPSFFADQEASQTGSLDSSLYDAPEPVELHTPTTVWVEEVEEVEEITTPAPRFEDRFDAIEPSHVKPVAQAKAETPVVPVFMDPTEPAEPVILLAKREAEIPDVTEFMELEEAKPAPKPVPTLLENAKSAFSSLTSRFKSWLS